jgi:hypothetical protein
VRVQTQAISVEKQTIWLVFSSDLDVAATRPKSDHGRVAATRNRQELVYFYHAKALAQTKKCHHPRQTQANPKNFDPYWFIRHSGTIN